MDTVKENETDDEEKPPVTPGRSAKKARKTPKTEDKEIGTPSSIVATPSKSTIAKKLKALEAYLQTPFPDFHRPTPEECQKVQDALVSVHGLPKRPEKLLDIEGAPAGCGQVPDVLDALVRTILSQNTTSASESRSSACSSRRNSV